MKLEIKKSVLENILNKAVRLVGRHVTLPVLSCVLLDLDETGILTTRSTNLDIGLEVKTKTKSGTSGTLAVPGSVLLGAISSVREDNITLENQNGNLKIASLKNSAVIKCMPHEDFPSIPKIENQTPIKISAEDLLLGLRSVWYSASISSVKPELGSVYIHQVEDALVFVSTDSFRLAEKRIHIKNTSEFPAVLVPQKNVSEIIKMLEDYKGEVNLFFDKNQAGFEIGETYIVSRLIDGAFPDYKQIIPKDFISKATILKSDLALSVKASNIFSDSLNQVKLSLDKKNKSLNIEAKNNDVGEYKESIKANIEGEDLSLNFNSRYLTDCFQSIPGESITMEFGGMGKPLIIKGASEKSFMYIVMPMNR